MIFSDEEKLLGDQALEYISANKEQLIHEFILSRNPIRLDLITVFMAGSPGAGKTEFSKRYIPLVMNTLLKPHLREAGIDLKPNNELIIRLDVDEVREFIPQYKKGDSKKSKGNSHIIQKAASIGIAALRDYCLKNEISILLDGTFGNNFSTVKKIIKQSISRKRINMIFYIYLDPIVAWEFTKARELLEGRNIQKDKFIEQFFKSRDNVQRAKDKFGDSVMVNLVLKNKSNNLEDIKFNVSNIKEYFNEYEIKGLVKTYSIEELNQMLK